MKLSRCLRPRLTLRVVCLAVVIVSGFLVWGLQPVEREEIVQVLVDVDESDEGISRQEPAKDMVERRIVTSEICLPFLGQRLRHGPRQVFSRDGKLLERTHWSRGRLHGQHMVWHASGQLAIQGMWKRGLPDGTWNSWRMPPFEFKEEYPSVLLPDRYEPIFQDLADVQSEQRHYHSGKLTSLTRYGYYSKLDVDFNSAEAGSDDQVLIRVQQAMLTGDRLNERSWKATKTNFVRHGLAKSYNRIDGYEGQWCDGTPVGEWTCRDREGNSYSVIYKQGHVQTINGKPVDVFTKHLHGRGSKETLALCRQPLGPNVPPDGYELIEALRSRCSLLVHKSAIAVLAQEDERDDEPESDNPFGDIPGERDFGMPHVPFDAALTILLQSKNLAVRYRSECLWIVSQEVAEEWVDNEDILKLDLPSKLAEELERPVSLWLCGFPELRDFPLLNDLLETPLGSERFVIRGNTDFKFPYRLHGISLRSALEIAKTEHDVETAYDGVKLIVTVPASPRPSVQPKADGRFGS